MMQKKHDRARKSFPHQGWDRREELCRPYRLLVLVFEHAKVGDGREEVRGDRSAQVAAEIVGGAVDIVCIA